MPPFYHGSLRALEHHATIRISPKRADVASHYVLENRSKRPVTDDTGRSCSESPSCICSAVSRVAQRSINSRAVIYDALRASFAIIRALGGESPATTMRGLTSAVSTDQGRSAHTHD